MNCKLCGNDEGWHKVNKVNHTFVPEDGSVRNGTKPEEPPPPKVEAHRLIQNMPADPVLRTLMIQKGLITPAELTETEAFLMRALSQDGIAIIRPPGDEDAAEPSGPLRDDRGGDQDAGGTQPPE